MHRPVRVSSEPKVIGVNKGIYQVKFQYDLLEKNKEISEFYSFLNSRSFWDAQDKVYSMELPYWPVEKLKKAKITDIMGYAPLMMPFSFLISKRLYDIMAQFNIGEHKIFEVTIEGVAEKFYLFFKRFITLKEIDFSKTCLFSGSDALNNYKE